MRFIHKNTTNFTNNYSNFFLKEKSHSNFNVFVWAENILYIMFIFIFLCLAKQGQRLVNRKHPNFVYTCFPIFFLFLLGEKKPLKRNSNANSN